MRIIAVPVVSAFLFGTLALATTQPDLPVGISGYYIRIKSVKVPEGDKLYMTRMYAWKREIFDGRWESQKARLDRIENGMNVFQYVFYYTKSFLNRRIPIHPNAIFLNKDGKKVTHLKFTLVKDDVGDGLDSFRRKWYPLEDDIDLSNPNNGAEKWSYKNQDLSVEFEITRD